MNGVLITVEGIDGSGKTTVTDLLFEVLTRKSDREVVKTKEPTDNWLGKAVREGLETDIDSLAEAFLFTADHIEHVEKTIKPNLEENKLIISDRYSDSFYAYQGTTLEKRKEIKEPIDYLKNLRKDFTIKPDYTIFLDIDPEKAMERIGENRVKFENLDFQKSVYNKFKEVIERDKERFYSVNANKGKKEIVREICSFLDEEISF